MPEVVEMAVHTFQCQPHLKKDSLFEGSTLSEELVYKKMEVFKGKLTSTQLN